MQRLCAESGSDYAQRRRLAACAHLVTTMSDLLQLFPSILLVLMIVITLMLLPLLNDEPLRRDETQRTDEIRVKKG